ncbi:MAG: hypothetical protein SFU57_00305 [Gemmatimonadales bacterium]|nr:hypothetical protein [Gemmatimonadales bacterium]
MLIPLGAGMDEVLELVLGAWIIVWLVVSGAARLRRWFNERGWHGTPTYLVVRTRPVYLSQQVFHRATEGAYRDPLERAGARIGAYMVSPWSSDSQRMYFNKIREWLESKYDEDSERFEAEWVAFHLSGDEAKRELHDLMVAWAEYTGRGDAVITDCAIGIASKKSNTIFAGIVRYRVAEVSGTLERFTIKTANGSKLRATPSHVEVVAT